MMKWFVTWGEKNKNLPNYLTYFRILVIPALIVLFYLPGKWTSVTCAGLFLLACITDWLDGYVARLLDAQSSIGRFLDPIADKLLVATALILLVSKNEVHTLPAIAIMCREILVSGLREFLAEIQVSVPVSRLAKWKTGVQMAAIFGLLYGAPFAVLGNVMLWLAALLTLFTGYAYLKTGLKHMVDK